MSQSEPGSAAHRAQPPIAFDWVYEGAEAYQWARDTEHWPAPAPQMEVWLHRHWAGGIDRAWEEVGMDAPAFFYRFQFVGPFLYARASPYEQERMVRAVLRYREVSREHGGALNFWLQYCRPRIERVCHELAGLDDRAPLLSVAERWAYGFHQTFTSLAPLFEASMRLKEMLTQALADDGDVTMAEVLQGGDNATKALDAEVYELTELARRTPAAARLITSHEQEDALQALRTEPAASAFVEAFDSIIARHGSRSQGWQLTDPTWRECPAALLALVRTQLASQPKTPAAAQAASEARRADAMARVFSHLPADEHEQFAKTLARLDGYIRIREDRAYWQMMLCGTVRELLLRRGARLVESGALERVDDMLFLDPPDLDEFRGGTLRALADERRGEWKSWLAVTPPAVIGTQDAAVTEPAVAPHVMRGVAASRGVVTGRARLIHSPEDGARLQSGDILVCGMSTPAWTPLFAVAAGIITESGGALSHPAITAREYGIPAVVAVQGAMDRLRDGQRVTIDGGAGTIQLAE